MNPVNSIRNFYNKNPFPGPYSISQTAKYSIDSNRYIRLIDQYLNDNLTVLDVGCGTGFITNLFATRYNSEFTGIDFSKTAITMASQFAINHNITNAHFFEEDFFNFTPDQKFDVIVCQSFLTHVPDFVGAIKKLKTMLASNGVILLGVYNNYGKLAKKFININYKNDRLQLDQEHNPFEVVFSHRQVLDLWPGYQLMNVCPSIHNRFVNVVNLFNNKNGGLTLYAFKH
jgi:2-polyprenyl-3-methyl-5-hydroxy-6-metoxy-1,4-benzoquinol methylase